MSAKKVKLTLFVLACIFCLPVLSLEAGQGSAATEGAEAKAVAPVDQDIDEPAYDRIRAKIRKIYPGLTLDHIGPSAAPGFLEVITDGQVLFVTDDGNYISPGLVDLQDRRDMAQLGAMPRWRLDALGAIPTSERIVFAPEVPVKHAVTVFTDVECGFCRKLHQQIAEYNKLGISIEYVAFPRAGIDSAAGAIMQAVWCADDRQKSLTDAMNGVEIVSRKCENLVAKQYEVGQRLGVQGTPFMVNADGIGIPGFRSPSELLERLDTLAMQRGHRP